MESIATSFNDKEWDYSITTGLTITLIAIYLIQCVRLHFMPIETRNKLTMTIWWSIFLNLVALESKNTILICLNLQTENSKALTNYALASTACFFFTNAVTLQTFEWDLLGSMIYFQVQHSVSELNVVRDRFTKTEQFKVKMTRVTILLNLVYHLIKVIVPTCAQISCMTQDLTEKQCQNRTAARIQTMLICDTVYACLLFIYMLYCNIKLIYMSHKYSRLESNNHMRYFVITSLGLLLALPLVINDLIYFMYNTNTYADWRYGYYFDWLAKTMPSMVYLVSKRTEDCFNCFNRLAPQTYSII